jgi:RsiW-degrading membrane proteinase PrsW (M82 family)
LNTLLLLTVSLLAGFLPMVCWAVILWWFDRFEKEPVSLLAVSFLWGVVPGISISLLMEFLLNPLLGSARAMQPLGFVLFRNDMLAPVIEEGVKLLGLVGVFLAARNEIDGPLDGMIYAAMIGFGFAAAENTLFFLTSRNIPDFLLLVFLNAASHGQSVAPSVEHRNQSCRDAVRGDAADRSAS